MKKMISFMVICTLGLFALNASGAGLSKAPIDMQEVSEEEKDKEILRLAIIAELDAVSLYEQLAASTKNEDIKKVLLQAAKEEKTHVGEFQTLLLRMDKEQEKELKEGSKEVEELLGKKR